MSNLVKQRKVTVLFTQTSTRETINTGAQTWGELQREIGGNVSGKRIVVRETRNTLESSEALLPPGDMVLFVYPKESKAGTARKPAKKNAKKAAKKAAKKPSRPSKTAKKAAKKKSTGKVSASHGKKISKTIGAVAVAKSKGLPKEEDLFAEARELKETF